MNMRLRTQVTRARWKFYAQENALGAGTRLGGRCADYDDRHLELPQTSFDV